MVGVARLTLATYAVRNFTDSRFDTSIITPIIIKLVEYLPFGFPPLVALPGIAPDHKPYESLSALGNKANETGRDSSRQQ